MTLDEIQNLMRSGRLKNPHEASEYRVLLAGESSYQMGQLEEIMERKADAIMVLLETHKTNASAEKAWLATEDGKLEQKLKSRIKRITVVLQSLNTLIRMCESEARNQF